MIRHYRRDGWYKKKAYPHLDLPLTYESAAALVTNADRVASHSFWPFLGYEDKKRKFKKVKNVKIVKTKQRDLKYCAHSDGYIHSYYAKLLSKKYEDYICNKPYAHCILGYRRGIGTNIRMASNAFAEIGKRGNCRAICMDIEDFFGSINHQILLFNLKMILGVERLTPDWFAVYKSMTKFSWIDIEALCNELNIDAKNQPRPLCATETYRTIVRKEARLVNKNQNAWGIPQGSPMSAVLSNVYMVTFDNNMFEYMSNINGSYRRYSDDILLISDIGADSGVADVVDNELTKLGRSIKINHEKTERSEFSIVDDMQHVDRPVTYLGFTFDGEKSKIRDRTISRFYRRMTYAARQAANTAKRNDSPLVFKRKLFRHFSHLGKANLYSYARRAAAAMDDMTPKLQLKRHFKILLRKIKTRGR